MGPKLANVNTWNENPHEQYFNSETYFQTEVPMDSSSLIRWRKRIGEKGVETLLMVSIDAARKIGMMKIASVDRVIEDTIAIPKMIAHSSDSQPLLKKLALYFPDSATTNRSVNGK